MADTNWDICFIYQVSTNDNVCSSAYGHKTLVKNIIPCNKINRKIESHEKFNCKMIEMATKLNHEAVLCLLTSGDVAIAVNSPSPALIKVRVCAIQNANR